MAYIAGIVIVGLFFIVLHYFTELSKSQKLIVTTILTAIILGAIIYNNISNAQRDKMLSVVTKFRQSKTIICKGISVNDVNYSLSIGTFTFIGKESTPNYGIMISATDCE